MEHFGERLRNAREKRGLTQKQLADTLVKMEFLEALKTDVIRKYEHGIVYPNAHRIHDFCIILGVSADYLLGLKEMEE